MASKAKKDDKDNGGFLRKGQVVTLTTLSGATIWRRVKAGTFPKPLKLSERITVWRAADVQAWIAAQGVQA